MKKKKPAKKRQKSIKISRVAQTTSTNSAKTTQKYTKKASKRFPLVAIASMLVLLISGLLAFLLWPKGARVAFYDVDPVLAQQVSSVIADWAKAEKVKLQVQTKPLANLDKKTLSSVDAVLLYPSMANQKFAAQFATVPPSKLSAISLPLHNSLQTKGVSWVVPLLADTQEIAWNKDFFTDAFMQDISLISLSAHLDTQKAKTSLPPVLAMGGNDRQLLDLVGIAVLEKGGIAAYENLSQAIDNLKTETDVIEGLFRQSLGTCTLGDALQIFIDWRKNALIHPNWLQMNQQDLQSFYEISTDTGKQHQNPLSAKIALQTLSQRRQIPYQSVNGWSSLVPAVDSKKGSSIVTASLLSLAKPQTSRNADIERLAEWLLSPSGQAELQKQTRLAPVTSGAKTADIQASTARAAISSTSLVQGLSLDSFVDDIDRARVAQAMRIYLQN